MSKTNEALSVDAKDAFEKARQAVLASAERVILSSNPHKKIRSVRVGRTAAERTFVEEAQSKEPTSDNSSLMREMRISDARVEEGKSTRSATRLGSCAIYPEILQQKTLEQLAVVGNLEIDELLRQSYVRHISVPPDKKAFDQLLLF